jgi:hypothetical protein
MLKFVSDLWQVSGFLWVLQGHPPIKLTTTIYKNLTIVMSDQFFKISDEKNSPPNEQTVNSHMNLVCFECALVGVVVLLLLTFMLLWWELLSYYY